MTSRAIAARVMPCPECGAAPGVLCVGIQNKGTTPCWPDLGAYGDRCMAHRSPAQCLKWQAVGRTLHNGRSHNGRLHAFWQWQKAGQAALRRTQLAVWFREYGHILTGGRS